MEHKACCRKYAAVHENQRRTWGVALSLPRRHARVQLAFAFLSEAERMARAPQPWEQLPADERVRYVRAARACSRRICEALMDEAPSDGPDLTS